MLRRTSTLLLCLGALALLSTGSHGQNDDQDKFTIDLATIDGDSDMLALDDGDTFDAGPSSGPFSNKPGWPNDGSGQLDNPAPAPAPTTAVPASATTAPALTTTASALTPTTSPTGIGASAAVTPAPTPSMVPATKPNSYATSTPGTTTSKPTPATITSKSTPALTGQLDTSTSKCPKGSVLVSVEGKGSYCVSTLGPICSGTSDKGKCPGKQSGLEQGSHCGVVKSGVFGCLPGADSKRCNVDEDEDNY